MESKIGMDLKVKMMSSILDHLLAIRQHPSGYVQQTEHALGETQNEDRGLKTAIVTEVTLTLSFELN